MTTPLEIALDYIARRWSPIPAPFRQKGPVLEGWEELEITPETAPRFFNGQPLNIGVKTGPRSMTSLIS